MAKDDLHANLSIIRGYLTEPAMLEQMAEECTELAQALLKKSRKLRGENFTPMTITEINKNVQEEFSDVILCALALNMYADEDILEDKCQRWVERNKCKD